MYVKDCMTKNVELGSPEMGLYEAARLMRDGDFGILPISHNDRLVGMLTDRDIVVRCIAEKRDIAKTKVAEIMTEKVLYCYDDQPVDEILDNLGDNQLWRMPVVNREKKLVGILSLCDLAKGELNSDLLEQTISRLGKDNTQAHAHERVFASKSQDHERQLN